MTTSIRYLDLGTDTADDENRGGVSRVGEVPEGAYFAVGGERGLSLGCFPRLAGTCDVGVGLAVF